MAEGASLSISMGHCLDNSSPQSAELGRREVTKILRSGFLGCRPIKSRASLRIPPVRNRLQTSSVRCSVVEQSAPALRATTHVALSPLVANSFNRMRTFSEEELCQWQCLRPRATALAIQSSLGAYIQSSAKKCPHGTDQVQVPDCVVIPPSNKKVECYGVFCVTYDLHQDEKPKSWKKLLRIAVSGAAGTISNHLLFKIAAGEVFGPDQPIALNLLGSERSRNALEGVAMELEDSLYPLLREVNIGIDSYEVFRDAEWALLIGAKPRGPGMERADLLDINGQIFAEQGKALNAVANENVKVIVVGNPCNTNALICMKNAPRIPRKNFHALTRLDENRAKCQLALKAGVFYDNVSNVTIWGNHSTTQVPDFVNAKINGKPVTDIIKDQKWLEEEFTQTVQKRGGVLIKKWGRSSAASTAVSIADAMKSLATPTKEGDWFSSAVYTAGNPYGIDNDLVFSMPCRSKGDGDYEIVPDLKINDWLAERIKKTEEELIAERRCVAHLIGEDNGYCDLPEDTMLPGEQ